MLTVTYIERSIVSRRIQVGDVELHCLLSPRLIAKRRVPDI